MKSKIKSLGQSRVQIQAQPQDNEIKKAEELALQQLGQKMTLPGFRKGKAPLSLVREHVSEAQLAWATFQELVNLVFQQAIQEHQLRPTGQAPQVDLPDQEKVAQALKGNFRQNFLQLSFKYEVEVWPTIKLENYHQLPLQRPSLLIKEEEVEQGLRRIFEHWKKDQQTKKKPQLVTARSLSEAEAKARQENRDKQQRLARLEKQQPDDEWAKLLGFSNLQDLRRQIRDYLLYSKRQEAERDLEKQIFDFLVAQVGQLELPPSVVAQEVQREKEQLQGLIPPQEEKSFEEKLTAAVNRNLKIELILDHIAEKEKITVSPQEIEKEISLVRERQVRQQLQSAKGKIYLRLLLRRRKVVEWLKKQVSASAQVTPPKEGVKGRKTTKKKAAPTKTAPRKTKKK